MFQKKVYVQIWNLAIHFLPEKYGKLCYFYSLRKLQLLQISDGAT